MEWWAREGREFSTALAKEKENEDCFEVLLKHNTLHFCNKKHCTAAFVNMLLFRNQTITTLNKAEPFSLAVNRDSRNDESFVEILFVRFQVQKTKHED